MGERHQHTQGTPVMFERLWVSLTGVSCLTVQPIFLVRTWTSDYGHINHSGLQRVHEKRQES